MMPPVAKKAFIIAASIQFAVIVSLFNLSSVWGAHSTLTFGMLIQFPGSIAGVLIGELLQSVSGSGMISVNIAISVTVVVQFFILYFISYLVLNRKNRI
jgi:hypothetical protein